MRTKLKNKPSRCSSQQKKVNLFYLTSTAPTTYTLKPFPPLFKTGISPFFPHPFSSYSSAFRGECFSLHMPRRPFTPIVDAGSLEVEMITVLAKALEILYANGVNSLLPTDYL